MPVVLSIQSRLRQGGLAWRKRGIVRGCKPGAAGKYRIAGWANTWRNETDCSGRRNQAVALPRRGTLERPNSGGRPLSAVGIRTLPPGLVESSLPRRLHCGSRNHPQRMGMVEGGTIWREGSGFGGSSRTSSLDPAGSPTLPPRQTTKRRYTKCYAWCRHWSEPESLPVICWLSSPAIPAGPPTFGLLSSPSRNTQAIRFVPRGRSRRLRPTSATGSSRLRSE